MGTYLNPGAVRLRDSRNSKIYVDKSALIAYLNSVKETEQRYVCVSRPRRFGKTMAANMVCAYYDRTVDGAEAFAGLVAARDLDSLGEGGRIVVLDGWNMILGSQRTAMSREELVRQAKAMAAANPNDRVWIVFDGPHASSAVEDGVRITYTGGTGPHRADRFVCDFLRMARWLGAADRVEVRTGDRDFLAEVRRLQR